MNKTKYILIIIAIVLTFAIYRKLRTGDKWRILKPSEMRNDTAGQGHFGASRGNDTHHGIDLICTEGQPFFAPFDGLITRTFYAYATGVNFQGVEIQSTDGQTKVKIMYVNPDTTLVGQNVKKGKRLGTCANIKTRYTNSPTMINHIHIEKWVNGKAVDPYNDIF